MSIAIQTRPAAITPNNSLSTNRRRLAQRLFKTLTQREKKPTLKLTPRLPLRLAQSCQGSLGEDCSNNTGLALGRPVYEAGRPYGKTRSFLGRRQVSTRQSAEREVSTPHRRSQERPLESPNQEIMPPLACWFSLQLSPTFIHRGVLSYPVPFFDDNLRASPE